MSTSIIFSLVVLGAMGYLFYAMQKQQAIFKGEVLDIIATENTLLNKQVTLKIDELASVIENLEYEISQLKKQTSTDSVDTIVKQSTYENAIENQGEHHITKHKTTQVESPIVNLAAEHIHKSEDENHHSDSTVVKALHPNTDQDLVRLKQALDEVVAEQKDLKTTITEVLATNQVKQINSIKTTVSKQAKTLKAIEKRLNKSSKTKAVYSDKKVLNELQVLHQQQSALQQQLLEMQETLKRYTEKSKEKPYSYRAK
jgi:hypothetical protein